MGEARGADAEAIRASRALPATASRRAETGVDHSHVGDGVLEGEFERRLAQDGARKGVALQRILIAGGEFLAPCARAEQVDAGIDRDSRRPVHRRVEGNADFDASCLSRDRDVLMAGQLRPGRKGQVTDPREFDHGARDDSSVVGFAARLKAVPFPLIPLLSNPALRK